MSPTVLGFERDRARTSDQTGLAGALNVKMTNRILPLSERLIAKLIVKCRQVLKVIFNREVLHFKALLIFVRFS